MLKHKWLILISLVLMATLLPLNGLVAASPSTVTIKATDPNAAETLPTQAPDTGTFTVYRSPATSAVALTVYYAVSGTATNGVDYVTLTGKVTIPAGADSATIVVTPIDDNLREGIEKVTATLIPCPAGGCYIIGAPNSATVSIADND